MTTYFSNMAMMYLDQIGGIIFIIISILLSFKLSSNMLSRYNMVKNMLNYAKNEEDKSMLKKKCICQVKNGPLYN